jgi:hypothetical protein
MSSFPSFNIKAILSDQDISILPQLLLALSWQEFQNIYRTLVIQFYQLDYPLNFNCYINSKHMVDQVITLLKMRDHQSSFFSLSSFSSVSFGLYLS